MVIVGLSPHYDIHRLMATFPLWIITIYPPRVAQSMYD